MTHDMPPPSFDVLRHCQNGSTTNLGQGDATTTSTSIKQGQTRGLRCIVCLEPSVSLSLVLLMSSDGSHHVHIAPEAFTVASNEFRDDIEFWQQALPGHQKDQLALVCMLGPAWSSTV